MPTRMSTRMPTRPRLTRGAILLVVAPILCFGCGGGGGDPGPGDGTPTGRLAGSYSYVVLVRDVAADQIRCVTGILEANGASTFAFTSEYQVVGGATVGPLTPAAGAYTEGADRSLATSSLGGVPLEGRVADDGNVASLTSRTGNDPALAILMRRVESPTIGALAGLWTYIEWSREPAPAGASTVVGDATITAAGQLQINNGTLSVNLDGNVGVVKVYPAIELAHQPDGYVTYTQVIPGPADLRGGVSPNHDMAVFGGCFTGTSLPRVAVLVRKALVTSTAGFDGSFLEGNFESSPLGFFSGRGPMTLDATPATGSLTYSMNLPGIPVPDGTIDLGYGVNPDGTIDLWDTVAGVAWRGAVGPGGLSAVLGGGVTANADPLLMCLVK